jgi:hypothetical protein
MFAIVGEHLIRYTTEVVLPRIDESLAELATAAEPSSDDPEAAKDLAIGAERIVTSKGTTSGLTHAAGPAPEPPHA